VEGGTDTLFLARRRGIFLGKFAEERPGEAEGFSKGPGEKGRRKSSVFAQVFTAGSLVNPWLEGIDEQGRIERATEGRASVGVEGKCEPRVKKGGEKGAG
jgi:hypothetical protein